MNTTITIDRAYTVLVFLVGFLIASTLMLIRIAISKPKEVIKHDDDNDDTEFTREAVKETNIKKIQGRIRTTDVTGLSKWERRRAFYGYNDHYCEFKAVQCMDFETRNSILASILSASTRFEDLIKKPSDTEVDDEHNYYQDVVDIAEAIVPPGEKAILTSAAKRLIEACIVYIDLTCNKDYDKRLDNVLDMLMLTKVDEDDRSAFTPLDLLFDAFEKDYPKNLAVLLYNEYRLLHPIDRSAAAFIAASAVSDIVFDRESTNIDLVPNVTLNDIK